MQIFEVTNYDVAGGRACRNEYATKRAAVLAAEQEMEASGSSQVELVTWNRSRNLPGCKPDYVDRSSSLLILRNLPGCYPVWYVAAIHSSHYQEWEA